jgi:hypothetical protein
MEIGRSPGSVATGRTATSAKPFFSRTRRDATLAASGPTSSPGTHAAHRGHRLGDEFRTDPAADARRVTNRVVDPRLAATSVHRGSLSRIVGPPVPLAPADRDTTFGHRQHHRRGITVPTDPLTILGDHGCGRGVRRPPAGDVRQAKPSLDDPEILLGHRPQAWHHPGHATPE